MRSICFNVKRVKAVVHVGNCLDLAAPKRGYDLVFADPPFNYGVDYDGSGKSDRMSESEYRTFTTLWIRRCVEYTRAGGSLFFHLPDEVVAHADLVACGDGLQRRNWIILHQEFGQYTSAKFIRSKNHLLYFVKPPPWSAVWNAEEVLEPSTRLLMGDKRTKTAEYGGHRPFLDVWYGPNLGRVQGNNDERRKGHCNQLPELYLARIIRCASRVGDTVLDPFVGSGTTGVVATALGRNFVGCEIVPRLAKSAAQRIQAGPVRDVAGKLHSERRV